MLSIKVTDSDVTIVRLRADLAIDSRATTAWELDRLLSVVRRSPVVLELSDDPVSPAAVSTVIRANRMCRDSGIPLAVVARSPEARRAVAAGSGVDVPDIHEALGVAVAALTASAPVAA
ncbi:hypothetical protein [Streptomyces sp. cmx-4-9]|uniref:hypothetical protein n=1 Tax=Streptomyces sp. cmx-4-9 TaxID=2790941 RepID=UPI00397E9391